MNKATDKSYFTDTLYRDTAFGEWLKTMPKNVDCNYSEYKVDNQGTRVEITFFIDETEWSTIGDICNN
jgi:hypothetical protein